jgi:predicted ArsR family transcriptional regulator
MELGSRTSRPLFRNVAHSKFLTNHAAVLACIAHDPSVRLGDVCETVGITERTARRVVAELVEDGYLSVERKGRRNHYTVAADSSLHDSFGHVTIGELLDILARPR